jgi:large subunit ribosomal protein L17
MLRNMATSLIEHGKIITTVIKAKALKPVIDHLVTLAKKGDLHAIRQAGAIITKQSILAKLFNQAKENYFSERNSGYASVIRVGLRAGDAAPLARVELLGPDYISAQADQKRQAKKTISRDRRVAASKGESLRPSAASESRARRVAASRAKNLQALTETSTETETEQVEEELLATAQPFATEPETTEPEATKPEATEPEPTEPVAAEPEATEPEATESAVTKPEATKPVATELEASAEEAKGSDETIADSPYADLTPTPSGDDEEEDS